MRIRVMTYNILDGGIGREALIQDVVQAIQPDIIVLQEVFQAAFLHELAQSLAMNWFFPSGNNRRRVALLSRFPLQTRASHHRFPPIRRNIVEVTLGYKAGCSLRVFGIHPIANLALPFEYWRWWEMRYLLTHTDSSEQECCLIAGDLNAIAPGDRVIVKGMPVWLQSIIRLQGDRVYHLAVRALLRRGWIDCFRQLHATDDGFTLPPPSPNARLDYIFANPMLASRLTRCWVAREPAAVLTASDHYPLVAEFDL